MTRARQVMERVYEPLRLRNAPIIFVSRESAELAKYAANAFLAMKISFINELADTCDELGANVQEVATAIGSDRRIGDKFLHPGPGYGGSCFPKDVSALIRTAREARSPLTLIEQVEKINTERKIAMAARIERAAGRQRPGQDLAVFGVTFKPNTDDMRDAPSLVIVPLLAERGAIIRAYDPQGPQAGRAATAGDHLVRQRPGSRPRRGRRIVMTEWNEFRALDLRSLKEPCAAMCWSICAMCSGPTMPSNSASAIPASAGR